MANSFFRKLKSRLLSLGAALVVFSGGAQARAEAVDEALLKHGPTIVKKVQEHGYNNVGVLKFSVEHSTKGHSYNAGPINVSMSDRLENALVVANDPKHPLNVIEHATKHAHALARGLKAHSRSLDNDDDAVVEDGPQDRGLKAHARSFSYIDHVADRHTLLNGEYPLVWGNQKVKPDALLTGSIKLAHDNKSATVKIKAITAKNPKSIDDLYSFTMKTDRNFLTECGQSFVVPRSLRALGRDPENNKNNENAKNNAAANNATQVNNDPKTQVPGNRENPLKFSVEYQGQSYEPTKDSQDPGNNKYTLPADAKIGDTVKLKIENVSDKETIGVVVAVNGKSTLMQEDITSKPLKDCTKWILGPGESYVIDGFYTKELDENVRKFRVLTAEEAQNEIAVDPSFKGKITIAVFSTVPHKKTTPEEPAGKAKIENRSLMRGNIPHTVKPRSAADARKRVETALKQPVKRFFGKSTGPKSREYIGEEKSEVKGMELQRVKFDFDPESQISMTIQYYAELSNNNKVNQANKNHNANKNQNTNTNKNQNTNTNTNTNTNHNANKNVNKNHTAN
jgi:hypothetical protein